MPFRQIFLSLKKNKFLVLLLAVFFAKQLFVIAIFPIFQGPDEPVHYATVQNIANPISLEEGTELKKKILKNVESEIPKYSEEIANTYNYTEAEKISFHPGTTQVFADKYYGQYEKDIRNNSWKGTQGIYIVEDIPGYYFIPSVIEKSFSKSDIFVRFFGIRIFSAFLGLLIILLTYFTVRKIGFDKQISILFSIIIAFQPMFSQASAIINYDIILIFTFALFTYGAVWFLKDGLNWKSILIMAISIILGAITKAPALGLIPVFLILISYFFINKFRHQKYIIPIALTVFVFPSVLIIAYIIPSNYSDLLLSMKQDSKFDSIAQSISKYISTTLNRWDTSELSYWGYFGWLDSSIPYWIVSIAHYIEIAGTIGIFLYLILPLKYIPKFLPKRKFVILFLGTFLALQFTIRFADWNYFNSHGKLGYATPGRYFLPTIGAQFALIIIGLGMLARKYLIWKSIIKIIALCMIILWLYSVLIIIIPRYYL